MAQFTNQALLSYGNVVTPSNIATGEVLEALSITKTALTDSYGPSDRVTYIISITNNSASTISNLIISDNLGSYPFGTTQLVPLSYVDGSVKYFIDGILQPSPAVSVGTELVFSGISVNGGGNTTIAYEADTTQFAPLGAGTEITNTATLSGAGITPIEASETISATIAPIATITKSISPVPVSAGGVVSYTFVIENTGNTEITEVDNAVITDTFDPILSNITVTFNGVAWEEGVNYTYNEATGEFATIAGQVIVGAGQYMQDPTTGAWTITPATSTLVVTGNIGPVL
ncbi:MAG: hypothetical protein IKA43_05175 [Clostridia bacterium]|nr:hypothetical protein [Clostridia bacterium]